MANLSPLNSSRAINPKIERKNTGDVSVYFKVFSTYIFLNTLINKLEKCNLKYSDVGIHLLDQLYSQDSS